MKQKTPCSIWGGGKTSFFRDGLRLRVTLFLILVSLAQLFPHDAYSQKKVSFDLKNATIEQVFDEINSQTDYKFLYRKRLIDLEKKISIEVSNETIEQVLNRLFENTSLDYKFIDKQIVVTNKVSTPTSFTQQEIELEGVVTDSDGQPLPGVSILEKGTTNGTQTDFDGVFQLITTDLNAVLVFSYLGFLTQEIPINGDTYFSVSLSEDTANLEEVVVIGYGTSKARDLTGSVKQISASDFKDNATGGNTTLALQGRVAGVRVVNTGSSPGVSPSIRIRGTTSRNSNEPLYVIDGQIVSTGIGFLNPNDIETITVLKEASAAAIYGSRAASGVILINTKRGEIGKPTIDFSSYYSFDRVTNEVELLDARGYVTLNQEWYTNAGQEPNPLTPAVAGDTNWLDEIFRIGSQQNYHLGLRGGSKNSLYAIQVGYFHQEGLLKTTAFDRYSVRVNNDVNIGSKFKISSSLDITYGQRARTSEGGIISRAFQYPKNLAVRDAEGDLVFAGPGFTLGHPLVELENNGYDQGNLRGLGNVSGEYEIYDNLKLKTTFGVEYSSNNSKNFSPTAFYPKDGNNVNNRPNNSLSVGTDRLFVWNWDSQLSYTRTIEDHYLEATVLYTLQESDYVNYGLFVRDFLTNDPSLHVINASLSLDELTGQNSRNQWAISSLVGRLNYNYKGKYLLTGTIRRDNSSRIHPDFRDATFPSISGGWVISEESFFDVSFIDRFKFRVGWGEIGNERVGSNYPYQSSFVPGPSLILGSGQTENPTVVADRIQNSALQWEATTTQNFGVDANLFENRLSLTADYFVKDTEGIIVQPEFTALFGLPPAFQNTSRIRNTGFEVAFTYTEDLGGLTIEISPNYTYVKNEVVTLSPSEDLRDASIGKSRVGQPLSRRIGYIADGIFQNQAEIDAHATQEPGTAPGDIRFKDLNGDGQINSEDRDWIGNSLPPNDFGLSITLEWNNFDLNILGVGQSGGDIAWDPFWGYHNFIRPLEITGAKLLERWHGEGTSNTLPRIVSGDPNINRRFSTLYLEDTDYFRIQNIQLGYNLPQESIESLGFKNLRLYVAGQNLFTFSDFNGFDPQTGYSGFPVAESIYFGLNATY